MGLPLREMTASDKLSLTHINASMVQAKAGKKGGKRRLGDKMISKVYNTVAARPIHRKIVSPAQVTANMSYVQGSTITASTSVPVFAGVLFQLSAFAQSAAYLSLFDQYKFDELEIWLEPQYSQSNVLTNVGTLVTAVDVDDASTPTAITDVIDHQSAVTSEGFAGHYHRWKPHMAIAVYSGAFTSFANADADWIDSGSPNVQHYGIKIALTPVTAAVAYNLTVRARVSFRSAGL